MKTKLLTTGLVMYFMCFSYIHTFCQINPATLREYTKTETIDNQQNRDLHLKKITSLSCDSNYFWAINSQHYLEQFIINGDSIYSDGIIDTLVPGASLAVCNNLNDGVFSPTFYTNDANNNTYFYNGDFWDTISEHSLHQGGNAGGNGNYLYFERIDEDLPHYLERYDGTSFSTIYTSDSLYFMIADIAVDDSGYILSCVAKIFFLQYSKYIDVISPYGQLVKRYNFVFDTYHAYGCFMLKGVFYLGLGSDNTHNPNSLIPITFSNDSAYIGEPIPMPVGNWYDLASCNAGSLSSMNNSSSISDFKLYPNPAQNRITIEFRNSNMNQKYISIYNIDGQLLLQQQTLQNKTDLDISLLKNGVYIIKIRNGDLIKVAQFIKI